MKPPSFPISSDILLNPNVIATFCETNVVMRNVLRRTRSRRFFCAGENDAFLKNPGKKRVDYLIHDAQIIQIQNKLHNLVG